MNGKTALKVFDQRKFLEDVVAYRDRQGWSNTQLSLMTGMDNNTLGKILKTLNFTPEEAKRSESYMYTRSKPSKHESGVRHAVLTLAHVCKLGYTCDLDINKYIIPEGI